MLFVAALLVREWRMSVLCCVELRCWMLVRGKCDWGRVSWQLGPAPVAAALLVVHIELRATSQ